MATRFTRETIRKIKNEMAKAGLNQTSLAEAVGTSPQRISNALTRSQHTLSAGSLKKISEFFGIEPEFEQTSSSNIDAHRYKLINDKAFALSLEIVKEKDTSMSVKKKAADLLSTILLEKV